MNNLEATNPTLFLHHSSILFLYLVQSLLYKCIHSEAFLFYTIQTKSKYLFLQNDVVFYLNRFSFCFSLNIHAQPNTLHHEPTALTY